MKFLFLIFIVIPVIELFILLKVGDIIGGEWVIFMVFFTAFLGYLAVREQGMQTLFRFNERLTAGEAPAEAVVEAVLLLMAGIALMLPGLISDLLGFSLVLPVIRRGWMMLLIRRAAKGGAGFRRFNESRFNSSGFRSSSSYEPSGRGSQTTVEGSYTVEPAEGKTNKLSVECRDEIKGDSSSARELH